MPFTTLLIVSSPLQAIHARHFLGFRNIQAQHCVAVILQRQNVKDSEIIRQILSQHVKTFYELTIPHFILKRMTSTTNYFDYCKKALLSIVNELSVFYVRLIYMISLAFVFFRIGTSFSVVAFGEYWSCGMRQCFRFLDLDAAEFVLLDDGSLTTEAMAHRFDGSYAEQMTSKAAVHNRKLLLPDPYFYGFPPALTFFTMYPGHVGKTDRITPNIFYAEAAKDLQADIMDEVWICGTKHTEFGLAHPQAYLELCATAARLFPGKPVTYFPHRREADEKISQVLELLHAQRGKAPWGVEQLILKTGKVAQTIVAFGSTLLHTLSILLGNTVNLTLLIPPDAYFTGKHLGHIRRIFRQNMASNSHLSALFAADPFLNSRESVLQKTRVATSDATPYTCKGEHFVFQVAIDEDERSEMVLYVDGREYVLELDREAPDGIAALEGNASSSRRLVYAPFPHAALLPATTPVTLCRIGRDVVIATNADRLCLASVLPDPRTADAVFPGEQRENLRPLSVDFREPRTGRRQLLEAGRTETCMDPSRLYVLAWRGLE